ncbi:transporter [Psychromonas sp. MB-3u-54]|uniref:ACT domain-containing protein n=1 Tax=Psychromonas sp. MB-3u-54 TaxID=2058319 RepID=UPI000C336527|nr:ACT domain-containing protein [Psychromonas sp. MB-3u-54]PKH02690.1 transporter [Psychromonas sp. MB-3u-54]
MAGETNLIKLLASMKPVLLDQEYVFCTIEGAQYGDYAEISPLASYLEFEGLTLLVSKDNAQKANLKYESVFKCITLAVHSSLEAVGLTVAVSSKLTEKGISANVIAAYYHDHFFVQAEKADMAIAALNEFGS